MTGDLPSFWAWLGTFVSGGVVFGAAKAIYDYTVTKAQQDAKAKFLAFQLVYLLEGYAMTCADILSDGRSYDSSDGHHGRRLEGLPDFPELPKSENYSLLDHSLVEKVWALPQDQAIAGTMVSLAWDVDGPEEALRAVDNEAFILAGKALDVAGLIAVRYGISIRHLGTEDWNIRTYVADEVRKIEKRRTKDKERSLSPPIISLSS